MEPIASKHVNLLAHWRQTTTSSIVEVLFGEYRVGRDLDE